MNKEKVAFIFPGQASQTPGMGLDLYKNSKAAREVFDEADEILSQGFKDTIYHIVQFMSTKTQICLYSATIPEDILELSDKFLNNPAKIDCAFPPIFCRGATNTDCIFFSTKLSFPSLNC